MISYLRGKVIDRGDEALTLDVNGVGYELQCSFTTLEDSLVGNDSQFWVETIVREDAITLFGFSTMTEKTMFLSLLKVNGVGPKMAIKILSATSLTQLSNMIEAGDVKALSSLPKVGKKTAEQLILSLKGKLVVSPAEPSAKKRPAAGASVSRFEGPRADVLSALVNLGFRAQDAETVVSQMPEEIDVQQGVRRGLQVLSGSV